MIGRKFTFLEVVRRAESDSHGNIYWICRCVCGIEKRIANRALKAERGTKSCGCKTKFLQRISKVTHGHRRKRQTPEYDAWTHAKRDHGMTQSWAKDFSRFLRCVGERPDGTLLLRKDTSEIHGPNNTYWGTREEAKRDRKSSVIVVWDGRALSAGEWSRRFGWNRNLIARRLRSGWSIKRSMTTPPRPY